MFYNLSAAIEIAYAQVRADTDPATYAECDEATRAAVIGITLETPEILETTVMPDHLILA